ncbi:CPBP family intramembrane metalloprotease [Mucilaginibacter limnophilus]|uniref:CPBP family intramembrane metalloprotease n=1 Tax=Mucilaginibacter limnophilus TaxID=1932778 RepID=A0A3S2Y3Z9_9SPHI|nr:CPBP family intramembrane glutamic endopeptidase [Mucilaginibacter limnophilus]RVU01454.1 CPBP family intramembrane metalloprotease [Mucilaginibacter limnophilus]
MDYPERNALSPLIQFSTLTALTVGAMLIGGAIGFGIIAVFLGTDALMAFGEAGSQNTSALWILQITSGTIAMFVAAVIFAMAVVKKPKEYLKADKLPSFILIILVFAIMFAGTALMELLSNLNQQLLSLDFLKGFAEWARTKEDAAEKMMEALFQMRTIWQMLFNLLVVGLLTAISEEFLFRGCLQTILVRWTRNPHAAVWITAIIFSAFHVQFFGFLPRLALGVLFGYMVAWSGSIWPGVWAHFVNNGTAVVVTYLYQHKKINLNPDDQHVFNYTGYLISLIFVLFLLSVYQRIASGTKKIPAH